MRWSFSIGSVAGTVVRLHVTFLLLLAAVGVISLTNRGPAEALGVLIFTVALFGCVLMHEFGHVFAARAFGIRTPDVTLLPIGGVARLERLPREPWQELVVALAGPAVNVAIAVILVFAVGLPDMEALRTFEFANAVNLLQRLLVINVWLVIFNMIPAFPMDGGRVLRALLASLMPYARATRLAAGVGQILAGVGAVVAIVWLHPILFLVAVFIFLAARGESEAVQTQEALRDLTLEDAMMTRFQVLPLDAVLRDAAEGLLAGHQHDFPVLEADGSLAGVLTRAALVRGLTEHGPEHPVEPLLHRDLPAVYPATSLRRAFEVLRASPTEVLPVLDSRGHRVIGLLSAENIGELVMLRDAVPGWRRL